MTIKEVQSQTERNIFNRIPFDIYKDDNNWIPHLEKDIEGIFSKKENKFFRHGVAVRWILMNENGQYIGRIAAFINKKKAFSEKQPTGGVGFFECIDNQSAATPLQTPQNKMTSTRKTYGSFGPSPVPSQTRRKPQGAWLLRSSLGFGYFAVTMTVKSRS